jgi:DNA modification methylase
MIKNKEILGGLRLINGEALETMDKLIEQSVIVDAIICDPPY